MHIYTYVFVCTFILCIIHYSSPSLTHYNTIVASLLYNLPCTCVRASVSSLTKEPVYVNICICAFVYCALFLVLVPF